MVVGGPFRNTGQCGDILQAGGGIATGQKQFQRRLEDFPRAFFLAPLPGEGGFEAEGLESKWLASIKSSIAIHR